MNFSLKLEPTKYKVLAPPWEIIFCLNAVRLQPAEPARGFRTVPLPPLRRDPPLAAVIPRREEKRKWGDRYPSIISALSLSG